MHLARYIPDDEMQGSRKKEMLGDQMGNTLFNKGLPLGKTGLGKIRGKPGETAQFADTSLMAQNFKIFS